MPDTNVVLSSLRDELATVDRRRAELRGELEGLDREHDRLATTVSVLEERVGVAPGSDPVDSSEPVPLADRIVDALGTTGLRRVDMLRMFTAQGFTESAIDSAVNRLKRRGAVRRQGKRVLCAEPPSGVAEPVASASAAAGVSEPDAGPASAPAAVGEPSDLSTSDGASGSVAAAGVSDGGVDDADDRPLTHRVREAVEAGVDTREELRKYFAHRNVAESSVDDAVSGLRRRGVLHRLAGGKLAVAAPGESSQPVESESQGS